MSVVSLPASSSSSSSSSLVPASLPPPLQYFRRLISLAQQRRSFPRIFASTGLDADLSTEFDAVSRFSEIVPDTVIFDDFERFPPTAATVTSALLLGIASLPSTKFKSAIETALADTECSDKENIEERLSCFYSKALVNVGGELAKLVPGRVSTEVDARLAHDTLGIVRKVHDLLKLYNYIEIPSERILFKIPSTWEGIEASKLLESEGIQTHLTFVYSFAQAAAAAQAGSSVIQIFVGRIRDWSCNHSGDPEVEAARRKGDDPGLALVTSAYNYIHKYGYKSKLMAAAVRNKQDVFSLLGVDYIIAPLKILQSLKESITLPDEKYSFIRKLSPNSAMACNFREEELVRWDAASLSSGMGPAAKELLAAGLDGYVNQTRRVEELFGKIWPPPNV
ncbi:transaldolase [Apostasia shenzhenica]|uniref:transaldolase n=1 Tax=Apostasia shenzhenica TaxID=1088818 RepID=A0A2I0AVI5_9ASPA|nr:transaldolase [Apostasia shenzhenica]